MHTTMRELMIRTVSVIALTGILGVSCSRANNPVETPLLPADLFGGELVRADGGRVAADMVADKDIVAIYFSAQWCPPCRTFTPLLVNMANELRAEGKSFEVVFVSSDRSEKDMLAYMKDYGMPWVAVPHRGDVATALAKRYGVRGIPMLVVIDREGNTLSTNGRGDVAAKGAAAFDDWVSQSPALKE